MRFRDIADWHVKMIMTMTIRRRRSSDGIETAHGLDGQVSTPIIGQEFFYSTPSRPALGTTKLPIQ
jgi:hypothetical protein